MSGAAGEVRAAVKRASEGCSEPGCGVPAPMAAFMDHDGRRWCISHAPNQAAKQQATRKGGNRTRDRALLRMPSDTPPPDWSSPKAIRTWAEDRAGRIERGELDGRVMAMPVKLSEVAKATHDTEAMEKLGELEQLIRARLGTGA